MKKVVVLILLASILLVSCIEPGQKINTCKIDSDCGCELISGQCLASSGNSCPKFCSSLSKPACSNNSCVLSGIQEPKKECKPRLCGCDYVCSNDAPDGCGICSGEKALAQVCINIDGVCSNADADMVDCALSGGELTTCGSGCGPLLLGENLLEPRKCLAVCVPQCICPQEAPYWDEGCVDEPKNGPIVIFQKKVSKENPLGVELRAKVYNFKSSREDFYCASVTWGFENDDIQTITPVCGEYNESYSIIDTYETSYNYSQKGNYTISFSLKKEKFDFIANTIIQI